MSQIDEVLRTWDTVNDALRDATEKESASLLEHEIKGQRRGHVLLRIHSRYNRMRADRERRELIKKAV